MKSVGEFWFRIGLGALLVIAGIGLNMSGGSGAGVLLIVLGAANIAWTVIAANLIIRKAKRVQR